MRYLFLSLFLALACTACIAQRANEPEQAHQEKAERFVARLSVILNEERVDDFIPEIVVSREEFETFLESEWERTLSKRHRRKLRTELEAGLEYGWRQVTRDDGYYLAEGFIRPKNLYSDEKMISPIMVNAEFTDISYSISEEYDKAYGEISHFRLYIVSAKYITQSTPIYENKIWFPCILTTAGQFKLVAHVKAELVSVQLPEK